MEIMLNAGTIFLNPLDMIVFIVGHSYRVSLTTSDPDNKGL